MADRSRHDGYIDGNQSCVIHEHAIIGMHSGSRFPHGGDYRMLDSIY
jgi:hypothetical protein